MAFFLAFVKFGQEIFCIRFFLFKTTFLRFHEIFLKLIITMILYENFELICRKNVMCLMIPIFLEK